MTINRKKEVLSFNICQSNQHSEYNSNYQLLIDRLESLNDFSAKQFAESILALKEISVHNFKKSKLFNDSEFDNYIKSRKKIMNQISQDYPILTLQFDKNDSNSTICYNSISNISMNYKFALLFEDNIQDYLASLMRTGLQGVFQNQDYFKFLGKIISSLCNISQMSESTITDNLVFTLKNGQRFETQMNIIFFQFLSQNHFEQIIVSYYIPKKTDTLPWNQVPSANSLHFHKDLMSDQSSNSDSDSIVFNLKHENANESAIQPNNQNYLEETTKFIQKYYPNLNTFKIGQTNFQQCGYRVLSQDK